MPRVWAFTGSWTGTLLHVEHIEDEDPGLVTPYWHVQSIFVSELAVSAARGFAPGVGASLTVPVRLVRDHIRFEDLSRAPYEPPSPDTHHRNETLLHLADPTAALVLARPFGPWVASATTGVSVPLGRTEPNPFELGRQGLPHQHIQFGTGTWNPVASVSLGRPWGRTTLTLAGTGKWVLYENTHGYRAGDRYTAMLDVGRRLSPAWGADAGLTLAHEKPETWDGRLEEEGNLGRSDLFLGLGVTRGIPGRGAFSLRVQFPLKSESEGNQVSYPFVLSLGYTR